MEYKFPTNTQPPIEPHEDPAITRERNSRIEDLCDQLKALEAVKQSIDFTRSAINMAEGVGAIADKYSFLREVVDMAEGAVMEEIGLREAKLRAYREGEMP